MQNQVLTNNEKIAEIQQLLIENGLSPRELSRATGVSEGYISSTLNYNNSMTDDKYELYKQGIDYILGHSKKPIVFKAKDRKVSKEPKKPNRQAHRTPVPNYIIHHLHNYHNVFVNQKHKIDDLIYTLKNDFGMNCTYQFDNDNGYIIHLENHAKADDEVEEIDYKAKSFIEKIKSQNLSSDKEIIEYIKSISSPAELRGFLKGMVVTKISYNEEGEINKFVDYFMEASK